MGIKGVARTGVWTQAVNFSLSLSIFCLELSVLLAVVVVIVFLFFLNVYMFFNVCTCLSERMRVDRGGMYMCILGLYLVFSTSPAYMLLT